MYIERRNLPEMLITYAFKLEVKIVFSLKIKDYFTLSVKSTFLPFYSAQEYVVYKTPDAILASLQLKSQNSIGVSRQTHRGRRMGNECSWPLQILQATLFYK